MKALLGKLPVRIRVGELVSSRYANHKRPSGWDQRISGLDVIKTEDGQVLKLWSDGGQSPPQASWDLILSEGDSEHGYRWTLYGLPPSH